MRALRTAHCRIGRIDPPHEVDLFLIRNLLVEPDPFSERGTRVPTAAPRVPEGDPVGHSASLGCSPEQYRASLTSRGHTILNGVPPGRPGAVDSGKPRVAHSQCACPRTTGGLDLADRTVTGRYPCPQGKASGLAMRSKRRQP